MLAVQSGDHIGTTFTGPAEFVETTRAFTEQAIRAAGRVVIFPGEPHRDDLAGFRRHLSEHSPAIAAAAARGQVQVGDSRQVQLASGRFDPAHLHQAYTAATAQAIAAGYRGLWVSVDMSWAAGVDPDALAAFEAGAFPLFTSGGLTALCHYDRRAFPPRATSAACAAHPAALDSARPLRHRRPREDTLVLTGEADVSNHAAFAALLGSLRAGDTLDIAGMTFIDVRGLATIVDLRDRLPDLTIHANTTHDNVLELVRTGTAYRARAR